MRRHQIAIAVAVLAAVAIVAALLGRTTDVATSPTPTSPPRTPTPTASPTTAASPTPTPTRALRTPTPTGSPSSSDRALIEALRRFAQAPGPSTAAAIPFANEVALGLADRVLVRRSRSELARPESWTLDVPVHRAYVGPFSALQLLARAESIGVSVGPHDHCASPPMPSPAEVASLRQVSAQPENIDTCLRWWTVDVYVSPDGRIAAVMMDLYEP